MWLSVLLFQVVFILGCSSRLTKRLDNGLALTPPLGYNTYNHYSCFPNQSIVESNAKALVDLGLADLGYYYVTTDCGWTVPERTSDGIQTWNKTLFPDGFPALGQFIHDLGLGFGVYSDSGIQTCMVGTPNQTGSLYHEQTDANTYASWKADLLKYDNCYSSKARGFPNVDYGPLTSPAPRMRIMRDALNETGRDILYQVCEWGVDFPSAWAPPVGNTWRITNDIIPEWPTIYRIMNQFVPSASYAGPGHWPDLDMLEVGNDIFTDPEEQTHFTMWAIAKSPLTIGCALNDTFTSVSPSSLAILKNEDVLNLNQDSLGKAANLMRRYTEAGFDVWAGPLSDGRTVAALVNWNNHSVTGTFNLPDAGLQSAGSLKDVWNGKSSSNVVTSYSGHIAAHGTLLMELQDTTTAGTYDASRCGQMHAGGITFENVYGITDSDSYTLTVHLSETGDDMTSLSVSSSASSKPKRAHASSNTANMKIALKASSSNTITIKSPAKVSSIQVTPPEGTFYPSTAFSVSGTASHYECLPGYCAPVGSKITNITERSSSTVSVPRNAEAPGSSRYVEVTYINNDVSLETSWTNGTNSRNITVAVNDGAPVRLDTPLSGQSSELFSPMKGWGDPATLGILVDGFGSGSGSGDDKIVVSNAYGSEGVQPYGADFVGLRVY